METFSIVTNVLFFVQMLLSPLHIGCVENLAFDVIGYAVGHPLVYLMCDVGLLIAMCVYCRKIIKQICEELIVKIRQPNLTFDTLTNFYVMSMPACIVLGGGYIFNAPSLSSLISGPNRMVVASIITGIVAVIMFFYDRKENTEKHMIQKDALIIGFSQLLSLIPGVYQLDISFIAMRYLGFSRIDSFRNFVLLSIPLQICWCVGTAMKAEQMVPHYVNDTEILWPMVIGVATFGISLGILYFVNWFLKKFSLLALVLYRIFLVAYFFIYAYPEVAKFTQTPVTTAEIAS